MLKAKLVTTDKELAAIASLSQANLVSNLSAETKAKEGFVSWVYTTAILKTLHAIAPSVVVMDGETLAGYALTLTRDCQAAYPPMVPTVEHASAIRYKGRPLGDQRIYFMGQICVAEPWRGRGIVRQLYAGHQLYYSHRFDILITEISIANPRSLKAHRKVGFRIIDTHRDTEGDWDTVLWDWASPALPDLASPQPAPASHQ